MAYKFGKPVRTPEEQKVITENEVKQAADDSFQAACSCLNHELFLKYKLEYEMLEKRTIEHLILIDQTETDPVRYGFAVKDIVAQLRHIGSMLRGVKQDAGRT